MTSYNFDTVTLAPDSSANRMSSISNNIDMEEYSTGPEPLAYDVCAQHVANLNYPKLHIPSYLLI